MITKHSKVELGKGTIYFILVAVILIFLISSCGEDDAATSSISTQATTFEFNALNNCNTSSGKGTVFFFETPYTITPGVTVKTMHIKTFVSNGDSDEKTNNIFTNENNVIEFATCFRFGSQTWFEYHVQLEGSDGSLSNPSVIRVNKPGGAF